MNYSTFTNIILDISIYNKGCTSLVLKLFTYIFTNLDDCSKFLSHQLLKLNYKLESARLKQAIQLKCSDLCMNFYETHDRLFDVVSHTWQSHQRNKLKI